MKEYKNLTFFVEENKKRPFTKKEWVDIFKDREIEFLFESIHQNNMSDAYYEALVEVFMNDIVTNEFYEFEFDLMNSNPVAFSGLEEPKSFMLKLFDYCAEKNDFSSHFAQSSVFYCDDDDKILSTFSSEREFEKIAIHILYNNHLKESTRNKAFNAVKNTSLFDTALIILKDNASLQTKEIANYIENM